MQDTLDALARIEAESLSAEMLFCLLAESQVLAQAEMIMTDSALRSETGPVLIEAIAPRATKAELQRSVARVLVAALQAPYDPFLFRDAQRTVLESAPLWLPDVAGTFFETFETHYRYLLTNNGSSYVAALALEGAIALALHQPQATGLLDSAIGVLLRYFPPVPVDPADPAFLPVKALKLLGRCYDLCPDRPGIKAKIQEMISSGNSAVNAEARFGAGLTLLYDVFRSSDPKTLQKALTEAIDCFGKAALMEESRSDAALYAELGQAYLWLMTGMPRESVRSAVEKTQQALIDRLLTTDEHYEYATAAAEFHLVRQISICDRWLQELNTANRRADIRVPLCELATLYAALRQHDATRELTRAASGQVERLVLLPSIASKFVQTEDLVARVEEAYADEKWRRLAPSWEVQFYELVLREASAPAHPKTEVADLEGLKLAAIVGGAPSMAKEIAASQAAGVSSSEILFQIGLQMVEQEKAEEESVLALPAEREIATAMTTELRTRLGDQYDKYALKCLKHTVLLLAHDFLLLFNANPGDTIPPDIGFLFAAPIGGRGDQAVESNLRDYLCWALKTAPSRATVEFEEKGLTPGKPDLMLRFSRNVVFPIEVKREFADVSPESIHVHFLSQAQNYGAATSRVSFLFVLDLTPKERDFILPYAPDRCYVDFREVLGGGQPMAVGVFVVPANRYRPSDSSTYSGKSRKRT